MWLKLEQEDQNQNLLHKITFSIYGNEIAQVFMSRLKESQNQTENKMREKRNQCTNHFYRFLCHATSDPCWKSFTHYLLSQLSAIKWKFYLFWYINLQIFLSFEPFNNPPFKYFRPQGRSHALIVCLCGLFQVPWHVREVTRGLKSFYSTSDVQVWPRRVLVVVFIRMENYKLINWAFEWWWKIFNLICAMLSVGKNNKHYVSIIVCGSFIRD